MAQVLIQPDPRAAADRPWWAGNSAVMALWLVAGALLLLIAFRQPLERNQEARVLEVGREMLGGGWRGWMIPHANGAIRLHKPPLAYWLSAGSFELFGVSLFSGRLPMVITSWLTLAATWFMARWLFNRRAAFFAAAMLAGTFFFSRYGALAETDGLTMFFVTVAVGALWRASDRRVIACGWQSVLWHQLGAVAIAGAVLSKGPPAVFPVLFLLGLAATQRRWDVLWRWVISGAPITVAVLALPWWLYVMSLPQWATIGRELSDLATGRDHRGHLWNLPAFALQSVLPWAIFALLGIWLAISRRRQEWPMAGLLAYIAAVFIPLLVIPQKQEHYLLPLMPPLMLLAGSVADRALSWKTPSLSYLCGGLLCLTALVGLAGAAAFPIAGHLARRQIIAVDWLTAAAVALLMGSILILYRRDQLRAAFPAAVVAGLAAMAMIFGVWSPTLKSMTYQRMADDLRQRYGDGGYGFYKVDDLRLCFSLGRLIELYPTAEQLADAIPRRPGMVVIYEENENSPPLPTVGLLRVGEYVFGKKRMAVYRADGLGPVQEQLRTPLPRPGTPGRG